MPKQYNPSSSSTPTYSQYNFFRSPSRDQLPRDKSRSIRLHEPTFRKATIEPLSGADIKENDNKMQDIDGKLNALFYVKGKS